MALRVLSLALLVIVAVSAAPESRLYGGTETNIAEHPYVISITYTYVNAGITIQRCVGSLISSFHVLTSGYCFTGAVLENILFRAGSTNSLSGGTTTTVSHVEKPDTYTETPRDGDIAVAFTSQPIFLSPTINIVRLPAAGYPIADGTAADVISWGFDENDVQLTTLKTITLYKLNLQECQELYSGNDNTVISERVLCADSAGVGTCFGDSGAPLVHDDIVFGIASYEQGCEDNEYPDVFTRVDQYTTWIQQVTTGGR